MFRLTTLRGPTVCWELVGSTAGGQRLSQTVTNQHLSTLLALCFRRCSTSLVLDGVVYTESKIKTKLQQQHHPWLYPHFSLRFTLRVTLNFTWCYAGLCPGLYPASTLSFARLARLYAASPELLPSFAKLYPVSP